MPHSTVIGCLAALLLAVTIVGAASPTPLRRADVLGCPPPTLTAAQFSKLSLDYIIIGWWASVAPCYADLIRDAQALEREGCH